MTNVFKNSTGWRTFGSDTLYRVGGGQSGNFGREMRGAVTDTAMFGTNDAPNWVVNAGAAGTRHRFTAWVRSASHRGRAKLRLREFSGATQNGPVQLTPGIVLAPVWQPITLEYTNLVSGATLDFNVVNAPFVPGEIFQVDNVTIQKTSLSLPVIRAWASTRRKRAKLRKWMRRQARLPMRLRK